MEHDQTGPKDRAAVLTATLERLERDGYYRLTVRAVASQSGVSEAVIRRLWPTKPDLVVDALASSYPTPRAKHTGDLRVDLRVMIEEASAFLAAPLVTRVLTHLATDSDDEPAARAALLKWIGPSRASHHSVLYATAAKAHLPYDLDTGFVLDLMAGLLLWRALFTQAPDADLVDQLLRLIIDRELPRRPGSDDRLL
jgi:AcrR family transcriptional regulator